MIGYGVELKNCVLFGNSEVGRLSFVGDSVIGENVDIGSGTMTINENLDRTSVRVDVLGETVDSGLTKLGAFIGDDVKIGAGNTLAAGTVLTPGTMRAAPRHRRRREVDGDVRHCGGCQFPSDRRSPVRGRAPSRVPRLRLVRRRLPEPRPHRGAQRHRHRRRGRQQGEPSATSNSLRRHRAHALGDARQGDPGERAPAPQLPRRLRGRAQRHHRQLQGAARESCSRRATASAPRPTPRSSRTSSSSASPSWATSSARGSARCAAWKAATRWR